MVVKNFSDIWYGFGFVLGCFTGFSISYFRLRWVEKNLDKHIFCKGILFPIKVGKKPPAKVYDIREEAEKQKHRQRVEGKA